MLRSKIIGTGCYIPEVEVPNASFENSYFFEREGVSLGKDNTTIIEKFEQITGIAQRRYAKPEQLASDLGFLAAKQAIQSANIDKETLDYIIVAHNFGDVVHESNRSNLLPTVASKIKSHLQIKNPNCVAYDLPFGCPGWLEGVIQAEIFIRAGAAKRALVIGAETLSRVVDAHDRDAMIFSDGSGAVVVEVSHSMEGVLGHKTQTHAMDHIVDLQMGNSYDTIDCDNLYIKMNGRRVYEFALTHVPLVIKEVLNNVGVGIDEVKKILIHQANDKMDAAIVKRLFKLFGKDEVPEAIMPMTIGWLGNSSVATIPTLLDLVLKGDLAGHTINKGDKVVFASVGAGMNINALLYQF